MSSGRGRGHGGARQHAGRKSWRERAGSGRGQTHLSSFFSSPTTNNSTSSSSQAQRQTSRSPGVTFQPQSQTQSSPAPRPSSLLQTGASNPTTARPTQSSATRPTQSSATRPTQSRTHATTSSHRQNSQTTVRGETRQPNFDADETVFDDSIFSCGKTISNSENLSLQKKEIMQASYRRNAYKKVEEEGVLWDIPSTLIRKPKHTLQKRWMDFFQLKVFNWIPEAMLGKDWRPTCPLCKKKCTKNGEGNEPILVFGQNENYWVNAPQMYWCKPCYEDEKKKPDKKDRIQTCFTPTSDEIMSQINAVNPELVDSFPCHISKKNAVDKDLMEVMIHSAVKGVGPVAMSENIISWHQLEWQKKENKWARNVIQTLSQPSLRDSMQQPIRRDDIEKCPEYFSNKLGGCTPSGKYLIHMFCEVISKDRPYYDSEVIKRARASLILAIDASYKVPKWMMPWGGSQRMYNALHSGTNECNEIIMQTFSTSDNHRELGANLKALASLGLNPYLAFTDDPGRDESLLHDCFSNIRNGSAEKDKEETVPANLEEMKPNKTILYLFKIQDALDTLSRFRADIEMALANVSGPQVKIALDCEWPIYFDGPQHNRKKKPGNINIVQLGSNVVDYTIILELYNFRDHRQNLSSIGQKLRAIFNLPVSCITGCKHQSDYNKLNEHYKSFDLPTGKEVKSRMDDVATMAINRGLTKRGKERTSLQALCRDKGLHLKKPQHVRVGEVFASKNGSLSQEALDYCALDVEAPLILHQLYQAHPDLTDRLTRTPVSVGMKVDIMSESSRKLTPIAQGVVTQTTGTWRANLHKLEKRQVLVKIEKVFDPNGIIHYPHNDTGVKKCKCGRGTHGTIKNTCDFYLYSQLGKPPFSVVEMKSRLRKSNNLIEYPKCIYEEESAATEPTTASNFTNGEILLQTVGDDPADGDEYVDQDVDNGDDSSIGSIDDGEARLPEGADDLFDIDDAFIDFYDNQGDEPTEEEIKRATSTDFNEQLEKLIQEADRMSAEEQEAIENEQVDGDASLPFDDLSKMITIKTVLGDLFHFMDRAKLPMHHEYKALFFRALRAAIFILNQDDVDDVKEVLSSKDDASWERKMAFDFDYIKLRVRRKVPSPTILYNRMKIVYDFFKDKVDSKTNVVLFNDANRNKFECMLELVKKGFGSDPKNISMYVPKTDKNGRNMIDKDGLQLYRSLRGTSNLESLHQFLTTSFGHTLAGPRYSDLLMVIVRHHYNWRMSRKNRPGFPKLLHYHGLMIDRINQYYEIIYGYPKYREWTTFNENLPVKSPFGIVEVETTLTNTYPATEEDIQLINKNPMLKYLAERQKSAIPYMPIRGENEQKLVYKKLKEVVARNDSLSRESVFDELAYDWNMNEVSVKSKIYRKLPIHFKQYVKQWRKNQDRRDAEVASGANRIRNVLEHVPPSQPHQGSFEPVSLNFNSPNIPTEDHSDTPMNPTATLQDPSPNSVLEPQTEALNLLCRACATQPAVENVDDNPRPKKRNRNQNQTCQGYNGLACPIPETCKGHSDRDKCVLNPNRDVKRSRPQPSQRRCAVCKMLGCPGGRNRSKCKNKNNNT